jgi:2-keto-4-pentenoate hydratase/2-oxohepta-3-ene-1,7-dioic acid hydratase in catechol pathway
MVCRVTVICWLGTINGEPRQKANTRDLIIDVPGLIAFATSFYTLMLGDVLLTGTPEGSAPSQGATSYDRQSPASVK